jgi:hypothetical protein
MTGFVICTLMPHFLVISRYCQPAVYHDLAAQIATALSYLNGQELTKVSIDASVGSSAFEFDLGARLTTKRHESLDRDGELYESWFLYEPSGYALTYRADGKYSWHRSGEVVETEVWLSEETTS